MNEITLPSRHRIRNSIPGGLRPSTLPLGHGAPHNIQSLPVSGEKHYVSLEVEGQSGVRTQDFRFSKQAVLTRALSGV